MTPQPGGVHCGETYPTDGPNLKRDCPSLSNVPGFSQGAPTRRPEACGMTSQRRFRRLFPAAVATLTLAASAPFLAPSLAHADTGHRHEQVKEQPPGKIPAILRADTTRGIRLQGVSAT